MTGISPAVVAASKLGLTFQTNDGPVQALSNVDLTSARASSSPSSAPRAAARPPCCASSPIWKSRPRDDLGQRHDAGTGAREARLWLCLPGRRALPVAHHRAQCRPAAGDHGPVQRRAGGSASSARSTLVNLSGFEKKYPWQLSGGMQQRASIARALAFDADLLLMDEPFGALDEIVRDHLNEQLLELWGATNKTICFVTHSIPGGRLSVDAHRRHVAAPGPGHRHHRIDAAEASGRSTSARRRNSWRSPRASATGLRAGHSYDD